MLKIDSAFIRFLLLFSTLYLAFGVASPFLPRFLAARQLSLEQIGTLLALVNAVRLLAGPVAGQLADRFHALREVLSVCIALAAASALAFGAAQGFSALLWLSIAYAAMLAPTTSLADALALACARSANRRDQSHFEYGWVRGAGSAAFIVGTIGAGQAVNRLGVAAILVLQAACLAAAAAAARFVPATTLPRADRVSEEAAQTRMLDLARIADFRLVVLLASLILGSHAMHDAFIMILWGNLGISAGVSGILWAESVAAEVLVFWLAPSWLRHIRPETGMALAAAAAVLRWALTSGLGSIVAFAAIEPLHGLTFALLHLCCMRVISAVVPPALAASAQALYAFGIGMTTTLLTLSSGWLYSRFGAGGFWAMAALAALSLPVIWLLRRSRTAEELRV